GVLDEHQLAHIEMAESDPLIQIGIGSLFLGQLDVAANRVSAGLLGSAIGGFHDARSAAGHYREPGPGQTSADFQGELVVGLVLHKSSGSEDSHARADEMQ